MKAAKDTASSNATPSWENPLIPNKRLRQIYAAMVELRLLEEHISKPQRKKSAASLHRGAEACLVSTVLSLLPGDLTSESSPGLVIEFLRGTKLDKLLHRTSGSRTSGSAISASSELPPIEDTIARLHLSVGAALASKKRSSLVVAYVDAGALTYPQWKPVLKLAASRSAPILFIVLLRSEKSSKPGQLSLIATACGVPGIPVDASDPIALYRVAQESLLRIRSGGGPVLMECIPFQIPGKRAESTDPIFRMQQLLLPRGIATEAWFEEISKRFANRLKTQAG